VEELLIANAAVRHDANNDIRWQHVGVPNDDLIFVLGWLRVSWPTTSQDPRAAALAEVDEGGRRRRLMGSCLARGDVAPALVLCTWETAQDGTRAGWSGLDLLSDVLAARGAPCTLESLIPGTGEPLAWVRFTRGCWVSPAEHTRSVSACTFQAAFWRSRTGGISSGSTEGRDHVWTEDPARGLNEEGSGIQILARPLTRSASHPI
jgi:hypothetical protein